MLLDFLVISTSTVDAEPITGNSPSDVRAENIFEFGLMGRFDNHDFLLD